MKTIILMINTPEGAGRIGSFADVDYQNENDMTIEARELFEKVINKHFSINISKEDLDSAIEKGRYGVSGNEIIYDEVNLDMSHLTQVG